MYLIRRNIVCLLMRFIFLLVFLMLFVSMKSMAQQAGGVKITLDGEIISAIDDSPVPFVHIINTSTHQGTASNSEGRFEIQMSVTDTLLFSAIGFEKYIFMLSEKINTNSILVTIELDASSMKLNPIKIFAYKDEHSFKRAIIEMDVPEEKSNRMQLAGFNYGPRKEVKTSSFLNPISFIQNKLSKKEKEKRQYAKVTAEYNKWVINTATKYSPQIVQKITGLPEDKVGDFMKFCKLDNDFISLSSEYEVVIAIQKCLREYTANDTPADTIRDN